jgi:hypothetical protein
MARKRLVFLVLLLVGLFSISVEAALQVGIYYNKGGLQFGYQGLKTALEGEGYQVKFIDSLDSKVFEGLDVVALSCLHQLPLGQREPEARNALRDFVKSGHGVILIHESVGWRKVFQSAPVFPEIGQGIGQSPSPNKELVVADKDHPITQGLSQRFNIQYDMPALKAGKDGKVLLKSGIGDPEVIVGDFGQGKVVLMGNLVGLGPNNMEMAPKGDELKLILNSIAWLVKE